MVVSAQMTSKALCLKDAPPCKSKQFLSQIPNYQQQLSSLLLYIHSKFGVRNRMDIPLGNIFEVTINSNKLYNYIEDIISQLKAQAEQIASLNVSVQGISSSISEHLRPKDYSIDIELEKMRKTSQEEFNYARLFMRDVDKKATDKMGEMDAALNFINKKLIKVKESIDDDLAVKFSYFDKRLGSISSLQEDQQRTKMELAQLRDLLAQTDYRIEKIVLGLQDENKKRKELKEQLTERINQTERELKNQTERIQSMKHSIVELNGASSQKRRHKEKKETQVFTNIINKIEEVEHSFARESQENGRQGHHPRRSNITNSKVVKSNTNINQVQKSNFTPKTPSEFKQFQSLVIDKLSKIQALSLQKFDSFEKEITKVINKNDIVDEYIGILSRKIDKEKFKITEVAESMKRYDDKKVDEKTIQNLKNMIKKLSKDTEEVLETKLSREVYEKDKLKNVEKMHFLNEFIIEKAEKTEVKKGLAFLQEKIKEIIIVLAEERGSFQDGALKKTPFKCLSCDKDLEVDRTESHPKNTPKENAANLTRCSTNQLRKRIRMLNNTIPNSQNDQ